MVLKNFWKTKKSKMADQRWAPFLEIMKQFPRQVTSSGYVADFRRNILDVLHIIDVLLSKL